MTDSEYLFWLDLETTGLRPGDDLILEVAAVVTTTDLTRVVDQLHRVLHWDGGYVLRAMTEGDPSGYVEQMHTANGLLDAIPSGVPPSKAMADLRELAAKYPGALLAGSGVHFDRAFLAAQWPTVLEALHYRNLDVSTLRSFVRLYDDDPPYEQADAHRAMPDVQDAIAELKDYRTRLGARL